MREVTLKLYKFTELSPEARERVRRDNVDINIHAMWSHDICRDAKKVGLLIAGFDVNTNTIEIVVAHQRLPEVAEIILREHGKSTKTYKAAEQFLTNFQKKKLLLKLLEGSDQHSGKVKNLEFEIKAAIQTFLHRLYDAYKELLNAEYNYRVSPKAIRLEIERRGYEFTADGVNFQLAMKGEYNREQLPF